MIGQLMWLLFPLKKQRDIKNSLVQVPPKIDYNRLSGGETQAQACFHSSSQFWYASRVENHCGRHSAIVESLSHVQLFLAPWTAAHQASLSFTTSQSLFKLMSIESVMPSNHLILCFPLLLLPSVFPSIRSFLMSQLFASGSQSTGTSEWCRNTNLKWSLTPRFTTHTLVVFLPPILSACLNLTYPLGGNKMASWVR